MKKRIRKIIRKKVANLYLEARELLLDKNSYDSQIEFQVVHQYFLFLETALQKPYNRLSSLTALINDSQQFCTKKMYPFAALYEDTKVVISAKYIQASCLAKALDVGGIDPEFKTLSEEKPVH